MTPEEIMRADLEEVERILDKAEREIRAAIEEHGAAARRARQIIDKYKSDDGPIQ